MIGCSLRDEGLQDLEVGRAVRKQIRFGNLLPSDGCVGCVRRGGLLGEIRWEAIDVV